MFFYYPLDAFFYPKERKNVDPESREGGGGTERSRGGKAIIKLYCMTAIIVNKRQYLQLM